jgi:hypothetical protein
VSCQELAQKGASLQSFMNAMVSPSNVSKMLSSGPYRKAYLKFAAELIEEAPLSSSFLKSVNDQIRAHYPATRRIRFRSSTNAEDLPGMSGAGLYTSESGCLRDAEENVAGPSACMTQVEIKRINATIKSLESLGASDPRNAELIKDLKKKLKKKYLVDKAIKKVFSSLWNERAFTSRDYFRIDHSKIYMAILVHPSFIEEKANGVVLLEKNFSGEGGVRVNIVTQVDDISITNPVYPGAVPEQILTTVADDGTVAPLRRISASNLVPEGSMVLSDVVAAALAKQLLATYKAMGREYGADETERMDAEFILSGKRVVLIKQIRPL